MNNNVKKLLKISAILSCFLISYVFCENFLATPNRRRPSSIGQIKQEIAEMLIVILDQSSKTIELLAKGQMESYRAIAQLANNDKNSKLVKSSRKDLEHTLAKLKAIKDDNDKCISKIVEFLKLANANFIEKTENKERC